MGSKYCIVCGDLKKYSTNTFFSFPKTPNSFNIWLRLIGIDEGDLTARSCVCSKHFETNARSKRANLPILGLKKSDEEIRRIGADYLREITLKSQRPLESIIADASVMIENEELAEQERNRVDDVYASQMYWKRKVWKEFDHRLEENMSALGIVTHDKVASDSIDNEQIPSTSTAQTTYSTPEAVDEFLKKFIREDTSSEIFRFPMFATSSKRKTNSPTAVVSPIVKKSNQQRTPLPGSFISKRETGSQTDPKITEPDRRVRESSFDIDVLSDKHFHAFSGVNRTVFDLIYKHVAPLAKSAIYWRGPKAGNLAFVGDYQQPDGGSRKSDNDLRCEMFLTLMKLRTNVSYSILECLFGWSSGKVSSVFHTWLDILERICRHMIIFHGQDTCRLSIPPRVASKFPSLRCIVDCTEIAIEKPQRTYLQAITYSQYKKKNTIKVLVAILPNGCIGFVSKAWTGRASDKFIMDHCGLMNLLERGDTVLADRGFSITHELLVRGISMTAPSGATGRVQFTSEEVRRGVQIANVRVHVERAIGRMKNFKILQDTLPIPFVPVADKIMTIIAAICNFQGPLIK